ncbi:uncharacterized protein L969DRAFT_94433 [Mixia osmundae IAM 14324]|uniref:Kinesin motor domain-containing protein n=1 Tax=Mixia osmundae (strain CBS 9802 / IAM 14324 / JCM 22182 / KY 12970) TaxID=764103 RepID=G7E3G6_MIXOS|nr:uncharacterized protein L969DRAFT_94433 [Mixia osmundae IAM 14324]KEI39363.1 hypothetical protein L969DRAFT_94433 [Mixia osmundae IAM 14324]GAA97376.1 hypothetical protein E5Q_04054 [Mixia osmundae IAM 14324]
MDSNEPEIWSRILRSVASSSRALPNRTLILCGQVGTGKNTILDTLGLGKGKGKATDDSIRAELGLSYAYTDIKDPSASTALNQRALADEEIVGRLGCYSLASYDPSFADLLPVALNNDNFLETSLIIALAWDKPWLFLSSLQRWFSVIAAAVASIEPALVDEGKQKLVARFKSYTEGSSRLPKSEHDELPMPTGALQGSFGLPIYIVCTKADHIARLERDKSLNEEQSDFIQQSLRTICFHHGAALLTTTNARPRTFERLRQYLHHQLFNPALFAFEAKPSVVEREEVFVPFGWDTEGKIKLLRDSYDVAAMAQAWSNDLLNEQTDDDPSLVKLYSTLIHDTSANRIMAPKPALMTVRDEQEFLKEHYDALQKDKVSTDAKSQFKTASTGRMGPMTGSTASLDMPGVDKALAASAIASPISKPKSPSNQAPAAAPLAAAIPSPLTPQSGQSQNEVLHNFFQSLLTRGKLSMASDGAASIIVAVRVRPFSSRESALFAPEPKTQVYMGDGSLSATPVASTSTLSSNRASGPVRRIVKVLDDQVMVFDPPQESANPYVKLSNKRAKDLKFCFDRVFDETATQEDVYSGSAKTLVDGVLSGYNSTVFAYGATGCGKTHTISGTPDSPGIVFLLMKDLFDRIAEMKDETTVEMSVSYLEIYNEAIRDLLVPAGSPTLMLRETGNRITVPNLSEHVPASAQEVIEMIHQGNSMRTVSPTEANAVSSRSHAVLSVNIRQRPRTADLTEEINMATLSVIDLAGSERASVTQNKGQRLLEGANINRSLLALGSCINALCDPRARAHVPFRDSKLTRLLKHSLGGNCRTVMVVCVSPSSHHFDETYNTLQYANRAKDIKTKVSRNVISVDRHVSQYVRVIYELRQELAALKADGKAVSAKHIAVDQQARAKAMKEVTDAVSRMRSSWDDLSRKVKTAASAKAEIDRLVILQNVAIAWLDGMSASGNSSVELQLQPVRELQQQYQDRARQLALHINSADTARSLYEAIATGLKRRLTDPDALEMLEAKNAALHHELQSAASQAVAEVHIASARQQCELLQAIMRTSVLLGNGADAPTLAHIMGIAEQGFTQCSGPAPSATISNVLKRPASAASSNPPLKRMSIAGRPSTATMPKPAPRASISRESLAPRRSPRKLTAQPPRARPLSPHKPAVIAAPVLASAADASSSFADESTLNMSEISSSDNLLAKSASELYPDPSPSAGPLRDFDFNRPGQLLQNIGTKRAPYSPGKDLVDPTVLNATISKPPIMRGRDSLASRPLGLLSKPSTLHSLGEEAEGEESAAAPVFVPAFNFVPPLQPLPVLPLLAPMPPVGLAAPDTPGKETALRAARRSMAAGPGPIRSPKHLPSRRFSYLPNSPASRAQGTTEAARASPRKVRRASMALGGSTQATARSLLRRDSTVPAERITPVWR